MKKIKKFFGYFVLNWDRHIKPVLQEEGILLGGALLFALLIIFLFLLPFLVVIFPFWAFNDWSKSWFSSDENNELKK